MSGVYKNQYITCLLCFFIKHIEDKKQEEMVDPLKMTACQIIQRIYILLKYNIYSLYEFFNAKLMSHKFCS